MGARLLFSLAMAFVGACATAEPPANGQGAADPDAGASGGSGSGSAMIDAAPPGPDACVDSDGDGVCDVADLCAGFPDNADADADTIADGCDQCPGVDDRIDVNTNSVPDCTETQMRTINLKAVGTNLWRGWHANNSAHTTENDNTITGLYTSTTYNSYYVFPLTGFAASVITAVTLEIELEAYNSADASETVSLWDVTATSTAVETTASDATIYNDLASGTTYGTFTATSAQVGSVLSVPLAAKAAMDATTKLGGDFVIGAHLDATPGYVRFGHTGSSAPPTVIRIAITYLP